MINIKQEWEILKTEIIENKPKRTPFSKNVVRRRELLLFAQCILAKFEISESRDDKELFRELYQKTMRIYCCWK